MPMSTQQTQTDIDKLNHFLQNELSAVASYGECIDKADDTALRSHLTSLKESHQARVEILGRRVRELGGTPQNSSGMWGNFTKFVEEGASLFGSQAAISALETGEDQGAQDYQKEIADLSPENQDFIRKTVLPEHRRSHDELNQVKEIAAKLH